jgi:hypothetical protein
MSRVSEVADDEAVARFAGRYAGALDPRNAARWAVDPFAPAVDGSPSPGVLLEERRRALYRTRADADQVARFTADVGAWQRELALAREALEDRRAEAAPPAASTERRRRRPHLAAVAVAIGVAAVVAIGIAVLVPPVPPPDPPVAAGVPGVLVAQASAERGARTAGGLDGAGHFVTVVVTCQGDGAVDVRLTDGTDARFACISAFPRTAVQPSVQRVARFGYTVRVTGDPDWAMTLSR